MTKTLISASKWSFRSPSPSKCCTKVSANATFIGEEKNVIGNLIVYKQSKILLKKASSQVGLLKP
jgi:hypothetical protein